MRTKVVFALIILGLMLYGCSNGPVSASTAMGINNTRYLIEIDAKTSCISLRNTLHLRARLTNEGPDTYLFQLKDKLVLDMGVVLGDVSARWSDGKALTPDLTRLELKPGESRTIEMDWVVQGTARSGSAWVNLIYNDLPNSHQGTNVPFYVAPCPGPIGP